MSITYLFHNLYYFYSIVGSIIPGGTFIYVMYTQSFTRRQIGKSVWIFTELIVSIYINTISALLNF